MAPRPPRIATLSKAQGCRIWLRAQRLDRLAPFGAGPEATRDAVAHLGYVQIDTINVIERCHHHILHSRIPGYERADLHRAQASDKSVFEYWTHALSYVPTADLRFYLGRMRRHREEPSRWFASVGKDELRKVIARIRKDGALTIRDIDDDVLVEKDHAWGSRKPSKRALQLAFHAGLVTVSERAGMLKAYELTERHFGWETKPKPASERQRLDYLLERALRTQGVISLDSACYLDAPSKAGLAELIAAKVARRQLVPVQIAGAEKIAHWARPDALEEEAETPAGLVHILSPFDPLIIQRRRLELFFGHVHRFEAYVPKEKRVFGYFALPVLAGDEVVALADLKTDRAGRRLMVQQWTWLRPDPPPALRQAIDEAMHRFERFQLA